MLNVAQIRNIAQKTEAISGKVVYSTACTKPTILDAFKSQLTNPETVKKCVNDLRKQAEPQKDFAEKLFKAKAEQEGLSVFVLGKKAGESQAEYAKRLSAANEADVLISARVKKEESSSAKVRNWVGKMKNFEGPLDAEALKKYEESKQIMNIFLGEMPLKLKYKHFINDMLGLRYIQNKSTVKGKEVTDVIARNLNSMHSDGQISLRRFENYKGKGITPYTTEERVAHLKDLKYLDEKGVERNVVYAEALKPSGYTRINADATVNGVNAEIQIGGKHTTHIGEREHLLYDTRSGKKLDTDKYTREEKILAREMVKEYKKVLAENNLNQTYGEYLREMWQTARNAEVTGCMPIYNSVPRGVNPILSVENLLSFKH